MEQRENALREALLKNNDETERWELYKKENETAIQNLQEFSKHLAIDVMVPMGKKAFMPGQLIHTNEVLVGHYQGYFSKCSAHKATEICELRLRQAGEQLKKLETEAEFWQNKLEKPYLEGVLPNADEREIIEDYDEEQEQRWREEHKINVKRAKLREKKEREEEAYVSTKPSIDEESKSDEDIFKLLEEAELLEELENELDKLEVDEINDETMRKLMVGEIKLPKQKTRNAHEPKSIHKTDIESLNGVVKKTTAELSREKPPATNNNTRTNLDIHIAQFEDATNEDDNEFTEEVRIIRDQAKFLPASDQVGFYEYQVEIIRKKVSKMRMVKESDVDEKLHLLTVQAELEDLLALAEDEIESIESKNESDIDFNEETLESEVEKPASGSTQNRRISFALENETLLFRDTEAVSQMLPKSNSEEDEKASKRDVIRLHDDVLHDSVDRSEFQSLCDKKQSILEKVEKNRQYVVENQSQVDSDLVTKILDEATSTAKTIFITFKHSHQQAEKLTGIISSVNIDNAEEGFMPAKPSDFYDLYLSQQQKLSTQATNIYVNGYIGEENVKAPILKEANRQIAYEDPRTKFSAPNGTIENTENSAPAKSILRNKSAVEHETHLTNPKSGSKKTKKKAAFNEDEYMSAYYKVMNDVVEKPLTEPDPLPQEKFIDAHTPKKRVSRFKQMRTEIEKP